MRTDFYWWHPTQPKPGWRKIATRHGMSGWTSHLWHKRGRARAAAAPSASRCRRCVRDVGVRVADVADRERSHGQAVQMG